MSDYQKMYYTLFNKITDIIDDLQEVQRQTEEMYVSSDELSIEICSAENEKNDSISTIP